MQSQNKGEMFSIIHECQDLLRKAGLEAAPKETFFIKKIEIFGIRHFI